MPLPPIESNIAAEQGTGSDFDWETAAEMGMSLWEWASQQGGGSAVADGSTPESRARSMAYLQSLVPAADLVHTAGGGVAAVSPAMWEAAQEDLVVVPVGPPVAPGTGISPAVIAGGVVVGGGIVLSGLALLAWLATRKGR